MEMDLVYTSSHPMASQKGCDYYAQFKDARESCNTLGMAINEWMKASEQSDNPILQAWLAKAYLMNGNIHMTQLFLERLGRKTGLSKEVRHQIAKVKASLLLRKGELEQAELAIKEALSLEAPLKRGSLYLAYAALLLEQNSVKNSASANLKVILMSCLGLALTFLGEPIYQWLPSVTFMFIKNLTYLFNSEARLSSLLRMHQSYPGLELLLVEIGRCYYQQGQYDEAEFWYTRALDRFPLSDTAHQELVNLYQTTQQTELLIETLEQWLKVRPNCGELLLALSQVLTQNPDKWEDAITMAKQALNTVQDQKIQAKLYNHLGNLYYQTVQQPEAAAVAFQAAITLDSENFEPYIQLGTLYYDRAEYKLSQSIFEKALALSPHNARILCNLGYLAWLQGHVENAQKYYEKSIAEDPAYDIALNNLGVLYLDHIGNIDQALNLFEQTLLANPHYALCYYNMGRAYSFLGQPIEAAECFMQAQTLNYDSEELDNRELAERIQQLFASPEPTRPTEY